MACEAGAPVLPCVIVTMTSCKRLELFQRTMRSIQAHWLGPGTVKSPRDPRVLEWVVVDDNSSEEDRVRMVWEFGSWVTFVFKGPATRGHVHSMNLLLQRVRASGATWWLHLEDDWEFQPPAQDYISKGIRCLTTHPHVHQVLFNLNYAESPEALTHVRGDKPLDAEFSEHVHVLGVEFPYRNHHYWPHFSLRPSLVRVDALAAVPGDFTSPRAFFEQDFARKWTLAGLRSAFFRQVCCIHIGRHTVDSKNPDAPPNAYALNGVPQLYDPGAVAAPAAARDAAPSCPAVVFEDGQWDFYPGVDSFGGDLCFLPDGGDKADALRDPAVVAVNTLGYVKHKLHLPLAPTRLINFAVAGSGIYIRKGVPVGGDPC